MQHQLAVSADAHTVTTNAYAVQKPAGFNEGHILGNIVRGRLRKSNALRQVACCFERFLWRFWPRSGMDSNHDSSATRSWIRRARPSIEPGAHKRWRPLGAQARARAQQHPLKLRGCGRRPGVTGGNRKPTEQTSTARWMNATRAFPSLCFLGLSWMPGSRGWHENFRHPACTYSGTSLQRNVTHSISKTTGLQS
jgi:hypothetical protein